MIELRAAADDRTGALETAGMCADAGAGIVRVESAPFAAGPVAGTVVHDLATRHVDRAEAAQQAAAHEGLGAVRTVHKMDSTLRGNWAHELVARHRVAGRRVLVVPSFPALGRTCAGGIVRHDGQPVSDGPAGRDPRSPVQSSRPADHLRAAGASEVVELRRAGAVEAWLSCPGAPFAVCDAANGDDLDAVAGAWADHADVLLAGTAATAASAVRSIRPPPAGAAGADREPPPLAGPLLVVCGSLHPAARRQVAHLPAAGGTVVSLDPHAPGGALDAATGALAAGRPVALVSTAPEAAPIAAAAALRTARCLAAAVEHIQTRVDLGTLIVLGGDTAAEVLGDSPVFVGGTLAPGTPWFRRTPGHDRPIVVTRAGGFGGPGALVELLSGRRAP